MTRPHKERGLRDVLGRSGHASVAAGMEARKLDRCHHDAGQDERGTKEGDGAQDLANQEEREDGGAYRLQDL